MEVADALYGVTMRGDGVSRRDQPAAARGRVGVTSTPVNRLLVFAFTSVAMVAGFVVIALIAVPLRGDRVEMPVVWSLLLLPPIPALFAAFAFWFVYAGCPRAPGRSHAWRWSSAASAPRWSSAGSRG